MHLEDIDLMHERTASTPNACIHCFKLCCSDRAHSKKQGSGVGTPANDQALHEGQHVVRQQGTTDEQLHLTSIHLNDLPLLTSIHLNDLPVQKARRSEYQKRDSLEGYVL